MIRNSEIQRIAGKDGVRDAQAEKDYIISWILAGISQDEILRAGLAFKGGTVLKKFYFDGYRYSEDMDFTLLNDEIGNNELWDRFLSSFRFVKKNANIDLDITDFGEHETETLNFYISYIGPLGGVATKKSVKVDISRSELLMFDLQKHAMFDQYSDHPSASIFCYSIEEIVTEKMRSLLSRQQPRDFYDLWYLSEKCDIEMGDYWMEFSEKAKYKGIDPHKLEQRISKLTPIFKSRWSGSMRDQIRELPNFEKVSREMGRHFRVLFKNK
jgi:predicted nucleotidyltransferase component of viral defense system